MNKYQEMRAQSSEFREKKDCYVVALALACNVSYEAAHAAMKKAGRKDRDGTHHWTAKDAAASLGYDLQMDYKVVERIKDRYPTTPRRTLKGITARHAKIFHKAWEAEGPFIVGLDRHVAFYDGKEILDWTEDKAKRVRYGIFVTKKEG